MDIFSIIRANIKTHLGQFIGVILMMTIAVASILAFSNVILSTQKSVEQMTKDVNMPDLSMVVATSDLSDDIFSALNSNEDISDIIISDTLAIHGIRNSEERAVVGEISTREQTVVSTKKYNSTCFALPDDGRYPKLKDDMSGFADTSIEVKEGEVYFASGIVSNMDIKIGDKIDLICEQHYITLVFAGYIEDYFGSATVGYKHVILNEKDYERFYNEVHETYDGLGFETDYTQTLVELCKSDPNMSDNDFNKSINDCSGLMNIAGGAISLNEVKYYSTLLFVVISSILIAVSLILFVVLLVVVTYNINSTIKTDYKNLGVLKSQGFTNRKLNQIYLWQYLSSEIIGMVMGLVLSFFILKVILNAFTPMAGFILNIYYSPFIVIGLVVGLLLVSCVAITLCASKVSRISPHKAISEGSDDISFKSRITAPIYKRLLSASLAFRSITSSLSQYIGVAFTAMVLLVLLVFTFIGGQCLSSKNTSKSVGGEGELVIYHYLNLTEDEKTQVNEIITSHATIQSSYCTCSQYVTANDRKSVCFIYTDSEDVRAMIKGRCPTYENEIVIGNGFADYNNLDIGDKIVLNNGDYSYEYIVTGFFCVTMDGGNVVSMSSEAAKHLGYGLEDDSQSAYYRYGAFLLNEKNPSDYYPYEDAKVIAEEINTKFDTVNAVAANTSMFGPVEEAINLVGYAVYAVAIIFVIIIVTMSCTKCFNNERRQLGIYKAMGFTSARLRLQFAFRFTIVFVIGGVLGLFVGGFTVSSFFGLLFGLLGSPKMVIDFVPQTYIEPLIVVAVSTFVFAYIASAKVKKVDVNELVTE